MNRSKRIFRKYDLQIVFISAILISVILYLFNSTREFGLNFLTEISGVAITVLLVDRILKRRERKRTVAIDQRILKELQSIVASHFSIWKHLLWKYFPETVVCNEHDLLGVYPKLVSTVNISHTLDVISIHHPESWKLFFHDKTIKQCFENYHLTMSEDIKSFIDNFKAYLEPHLLDTLLDVMESDYFRTIKSVYQSETSHVIQEFGLDPYKLDSYLEAENTDHIRRMLSLLTYSDRLKNSITEFISIQYEPYDINTYFKNPVQAYQVKA